MDFIAVFFLGFWVGLAFCRYGVTLIARNYPASKALALFRRELD